LKKSSFISFFLEIKRYNPKENMVSKYELMMIIDPSIGQDEINKSLEGFKELLVANS